MPQTSDTTSASTDTQHNIKAVCHRNEFFNEYVVARAIEVYNEKAFATEGAPLITASMGRKIHLELARSLQTVENTNANAARTGKTLNLANAPYARLLKHLHAAAKQTAGVELFEKLDDESVKAMGNGFYKEFAESTGWSGRVVDANQLKNSLVPISPFSQHYRMRETILNNGTEILYAKAEDIVEVGYAHVIAENGTDVNVEETYVHKHQFSADETFPLYSKRSTEKGVTYRNVGPAYTPGDKSGLKYFAKYLSPKDFANIQTWVEAVPEDKRANLDGMNKALGLLKHLKDNGIPYTVKKDTNPGQVKVEISNTKTSIRLLDTRGNENYIGRVYHDGQSMYLAPFYNGYNVKLNQALALVDYGTGHEARRFGANKANYSPNIGGDGTYEIGPDGSKKGLRSTYMMPNKMGALELISQAGYVDLTPGDRASIAKANQADRRKPLDRNTKRIPMSIKTTNHHSASHILFHQNDQAEKYLSEAVESARENFAKQLNIDGLVAQVAMYEEDNEYVPILSQDPSVVPMQQAYWDALIGKEELYKPVGKEAESLVHDVLESANFDEEIDDENPEGPEMASDDFDRVSYDSSMTAEEKVRQHVQDSMDILVGTFEPNPDDEKRFSPALVSMYMSSTHGRYRNRDNIVAAMYKLEFTGDELRGDDFQTGIVRDNLLRFDNESAVPMSSLESPFMQTMFNTIQQSIKDTGCRVKPDDIMIDANGMVSYKALQLVGSVEKYANGKAGETREIHGQLGQIFEPDEHGVVETRYNGSQDKLFTPGYSAHIQMQADGNMDDDLMKRVRVRGMEQALIQNITKSIRYDLLSGGEQIHDEDGKVTGYSVGTPTSINNTYRGLYATNYKVTVEREPGETLKDAYVRQNEMTGLPKEDLLARFATTKGLIRFDKDIMDNSGPGAEYAFNKQARMNNNTIHNYTNDNSYSEYNLTGHTNMAITHNHSAGYTDPVLTGSGKNQGGIRYLVEGAKINPDGSITPSEDKQARAPLMTTDIMKYISFMPADRGQMVGANYLTATGVAGTTERESRTGDGEKIKGVGVAQMTLQGFTFDDGAVISKEFADANQVIGESGRARSLAPGDKITDVSGNKSIVGVVIDRNMTDEEAKKRGVSVAHQVFRDNPELDIVQAPYSAVGRFNAASAKIAMQNPKPLKLPDGSVHEGCIGFAPIIITKHTADEHTHLYDDGEAHEQATGVSKGRKFSSSLCYVLDAKGASNIKKEIFTKNNGAIMDFNEHIQILGCSLDGDGKINRDHSGVAGTQRHHFKLPTLDEVPQSADLAEAADLFAKSIDTRGGYLEVPFPITFASGLEAEKVPDGESNYSDRDMYQLPVLSSHLRSGQSFEDGTSVSHDYTNQYLRIYKDSIRYLQADAVLNDENASDADKKKANDTKRLSQESANTAFKSISDDIVRRRFNTKHNAMRDDLMGRRVSHSATAVWTADANLDVDQVGMNATTMKGLGVKEGDYIMIWRDPMLRDYGCRYMRVHEDKNCVSRISVNPLSAVAFDGDFDGDSVGMKSFDTEAAKAEAKELFSFESTMLDTTKVRENGDYALIFNTSMDVATAEYLDEKKKEEAVARGEEYGPTLRERRLDIEHRANIQYRTLATADEHFKANNALLREFSDYAKDALCDTCATELISYNSLKEHAESLQNIVDHGGKGSSKKVASYLKYLGVESEMTPDGRVNVNALNDTGNTLGTDQDIKDTEFACSMKAHGTGIAGAISLRLVRFGRNLGAMDVEKDDQGRYVPDRSPFSSALQLTYLSTQGILQAKHDPEQAKILYEAVQDTLRNLWKGHAMEEGIDQETGNTVWKPKKVQIDGKFEPVQATRQQFIDQFMAIHTYEKGLDLGGCINREDVEKVADMLIDNQGSMMNLEDEETLYKTASPMDLLAYTPSNAFNLFLRMADDGRNLFEGVRNSEFAPGVVQRNLEAKAKGEEMTPLMAKDTLVDYQASTKGKELYGVETGTVQPVEVPKEDVVNQEADIVTSDIGEPHMQVAEVSPVQSVDTVDAPTFVGYTPETSDTVYSSEEPDDGGMRFDFSSALNGIKIEPEVTKSSPKTVPYTMEAINDEYEAGKVANGDELESSF